MKVYGFGEKNKPEILLLPGTCFHWKMNFGKVIPLLQKYFHVLCVSYDGFDDTENSIFPDMITETVKLEHYIQKHYNSEIYAAYGCSLGGALVGLLVQRKVIHIRHAIYGSIDLEQEKGFAAKVKGRMVADAVDHMLQTGKLPDFLQKKMNNSSSEKREYYNKLLEAFGIGNPRLKFIKKQSIYNQFYGYLTTPLEKKISVPETKIHIFYALKMGEKFEKRYRDHVKDPDILKLDLYHEELLLCYPEQWCELIEQVCEVKNG